MARDRCYECDGKFGEPYIIAELFGKKIEGSIRERDDPEIDFCHACLLKLEAPKECKYCYNDVEDDNEALICDDCLCDKLAKEESK